MNNHNFFDYLLTMSLRIKSYKLVGREYLRKLVKQITIANAIFANTVRILSL